MKIFKILSFVLAFTLASVAGAEVNNGVYISAQTAQTKANAAQAAAIGAAATDATTKANAAQAAAIAGGFATGQTYNCATGNVIGTVYTNSTGKSITVFVSGAKLDSSIDYMYARVNGVTVTNGTYQNITGWVSGINWIVPNGATYQAASSNGTRSTGLWCELK